MSYLLVIVFILCSGLKSNAILAGTISNSGIEIDYKYTVQFRSLLTDAATLSAIEQQAQWHATHLDGLFHSPEYAAQFDFSTDLVGGFMGTKKPTPSHISTFRVDDDPHLWIEYTGSARAIVLKNVLDSWLGERKRTGTVTLPVLVNMPGIYKSFEAMFSLSVRDYASTRLRDCTDSHYSSPADFSYFYNPYRCLELTESPYSANIEFKINKLPTTESHSMKFPVKEILSDNGNRELIALYFINGFDRDLEEGASEQTIRKDNGWKLYSHIDRELTRKFGFTKIQNLEHLRKILGTLFEEIELLTPATLEHHLQRRYFSTYVKIQDEKVFVARSGLFLTANELSDRPLRTFPKFWKEAWENGDFIYYGGHSGGGFSLHQYSMLSNLTASDVDDVKFDFDKHQVVFLDSCSSYAYYQDMYMALKPRRLHLLTNGLVSLFHLAYPSLEKLLEAIISPSHARAPLWLDVLKAVEQNQLLPALEFIYEASDAEQLAQEYAERSKYPSFLLNVATPDH